MATTVKVDVKDVQKLFRKLQSVGKSMAPLMTRFYGKVHTEVMLNFRAQAAPADIFKGNASNTRTPWRTLSNYTAAARLGSRPSTSRVGGILQASGKLYASMGKVREITPTSMTYGTPEWLSGVHQSGMTIRPKRGRYLALPYPGVKGRPRDYSNTFVRGKTIYQNKDGKLRRLFFLKEQVVIPARPHLTITSTALDWMSEQTWKYYYDSVGSRLGG